MRFASLRALFNRNAQSKPRTPSRRVGGFLVDLGGSRATIFVYPPGVDHVPEDEVIEGAGGWRMLIMFMGVSKAQRDEWARLAAEGIIKIDDDGYPAGCSRPKLGGSMGKAVQS